MDQEVRALNAQAKEKGYQIVKATPGPKFIIMDRVVGRKVGEYRTVSEAESALSLLEPYIFEKVETHPVGWTAIAQGVREQDRVKTCVNGHGASCLCVSTIEGEDRLFCAVNTCHEKAGCWGLCNDHYGQLKVLGKDMTAWAYEHTAAHEGEDLTNLKAHSKKVPLKLRAPTDGFVEGPRSVPALGIIGVQVRTVGSDLKTYQIIDKDGVVVLEGRDRDEIIRLFVGEDDE